MELIPPYRMLLYNVAANTMTADNNPQSPPNRHLACTPQFLFRESLQRFSTQTSGGQLITEEEQAVIFAVAAVQWPQWPHRVSVQCLRIQLL